jgi:hypothetical protein
MMLPCAFKQFFGFDCPLCGAQRSLLLLVNGHLKASFLMYPPLIPVLVLAGLFLAHLANKKLVGRSLLMRTAFITLAIVTVNYACELIFGHLS